MFKVKSARVRKIPHPEGVWWMGVSLHQFSFSGQFYASVDQPPERQPDSF
jgi:hypothetical protein